MWNASVSLTSVRRRGYRWSTARFSSEPGCLKSENVRGKARQGEARLGVFRGSGSKAGIRPFRKAFRSDCWLKLLRAVGGKQGAIQGGMMQPKQTLYSCTARGRMARLGAESYRF